MPEECGGCVGGVKMFLKKLCGYDLRFEAEPESVEMSESMKSDRMFLHTRAASEDLSGHHVCNKNLYRLHATNRESFLSPFNQRVRSSLLRRRHCHNTVIHEECARIFGL